MNFLHKCGIVFLMVASLDVSTTLGCSYEDIMACKRPMDGMDENETDLNVMCQALEETTACFKRVMYTCPPSMNSILEMAEAQLGSLMAMCQSPTGGSSLCTAEDILECARPIRNFTMGDMDDFEMDQICPHLVKAAECFQDEVDTCPEFLQFQIKRQMDDVDMYKSLCQSTIDNPGSWATCSQKRIVNCTVPLESMVGSEDGQLDMKMMCRKTLDAINCLKKEISTCPETLKGVLDKQMDSLEQSRQTCLLVVGGEDNDNDNDNDNDDGCTRYGVMGCMAPVMNLSPSQKKDLNAMCPVTIQVHACVKVKKASCPKLFEDPTLSTIVPQLEQAKSLCDSSWSPGQGNGLQSSFLMTLVAAMLAMLRHFL